MRRRRLSGPNNTVIQRDHDKIVFAVLNRETRQHDAFDFSHFTLNRGHSGRCRVQIDHKTQENRAFVDRIANPHSPYFHASGDRGMGSRKQATGPGFDQGPVVGHQAGEQTGLSALLD
jgi:hypothetical protein